MQQRVYALVIAVLAIVAIVLTALPWASTDRIGVPMNWNGFGSVDYHSPQDDLAARPLGDFVVLVAVIALLTAVAMVVPALRALATALRWVAALFSLWAAAIPIMVLVNPRIFLEPAFTALGVGDMLGGHYTSMIRDMVLKRPTLISLTVVLVLMAALLVAAAVSALRHRAPALTPAPATPAGAE
ncbi:hypothetical protein [Gordonia sp. FQ]|uniref:hypothetical protein n=1 Tax=Gordonia sp. FQ TaxID=3446634 RepID=UPI003F87781C